ncbi:MAG: PAS domain S-box protein, partial [Rhodothermales bacterium]|nr:PAS domain S-box protein [Rhodothermales bacterium]
MWERRSRSMFDYFPLSVQVFDAAGRTLAVNHAWEALFGLKAEDVEGFNPLDEPQLAPVRELLARGFAGERVKIPAHPFASASIADAPHSAVPGTKWLEVTVCPILDDGGAVSEVVVVHHDVSERVAAEVALRDRERLLREAQRIARLGSWAWTVADDRVVWSDELYRIYGVDPGTFVPSFAAYLQCLHPEDRAAVREHIEQAVRTGEPFAFEERIVRPDGGVRVLSSSGEVKRDAEGRVVQLVGVCHDVTELKEAEAALQRAHDELERRVEERTAELAQAEQRFRAIVEASPTPLLLSRQDDGTVLYANDRLEQLVGLAPGGLAGRRTTDFYYDPADRTRILEVLHAEGHLRDFEVRIRRADGTPLWVSASVERLVFDGVPALATSLIDVTERKGAEEALRQRTEELEAVFRALPDLYFRMEADGVILDYRAGRSFSLYVPPEAFLGRRVGDVLPPPVGGQITEALAEVVRTRDLVRIEYELPLDGAPYFFEARLMPVADGQVIAVVRDVTPQKQAEEALRQREEHFRALIEHGTDIITVVDADAVIRYQSPSVERILGYATEEHAGRNAFDFIHEDDAAAVSDVLSGIVAEPGTTGRAEYRFRHKDGSWRTLEAFGRTLDPHSAASGVVANIRDITERKEIEAELIRQRAYFEEILNSTDAGIAVFDATGRHEYVSPKAMTDPDVRRWMIGKTMEEYGSVRGLPAEVIAQRQHGLDTVIATRAPYEFEQTVRGPDGACRI